MQKELLEKKRAFERFKVTRNADGKEFRACKENDEYVFVLSPNSRKYGQRYMADTFLSLYTIKETDEGAAWKRRLQNVVNRLERTGLWKEVKEVYENLLKVDYEDWRAMRSINWHERENAEVWSKYKEKYPFCFNEKGIINSDYIFELSACRTKSMYFGKWSNPIVKERIAKAISEKKKIEERAYENYDVSFSYDPEQKRAWYSEEYKGCGNGHYYLAVDNSMAVFCEDD